MFSFKRADVSEIAEIQHIAETTWPLAYESIIGKEQLAYMLNLIYSEEALKMQFREEHYFYFVYQNDDLAGFASFGKNNNTIWKLFKIYILPSKQGSGAGRCLLDFVVKKVVSLGATELTLNVNRYNSAARSFYEKNGFTIIQKEDIDIGNGYFMNDYIMSLPLQDTESAFESL